MGSILCVAEGTLGKRCLDVLALVFEVALRNGFHQCSHIFLNNIRRRCTVPDKLNPFDSFIVNTCSKFGQAGVTIGEAVVDCPVLTLQCTTCPFAALNLLLINIIHASDTEDTWLAPLDVKRISKRWSVDNDQCTRKDFKIVLITHSSKYFQKRCHLSLIILFRLLFFFK